MFSVRFDLESGPLRRQLSNLERSQLPYAAANALNDTAADVLKHIQDRMRVRFDRPTRWTLNAFIVWRASKRNLEAQVKERPSVGRRHYLKVQEQGGSRRKTGLESGLAMNLAYDGVINAVIPTSSARLDGHGNWSSGERNQALSILGAQRDVRSNATVASRKRAKGRASYFVPKSGSAMAPGIWRRKGTDLAKVASFTAAMPVYSARLGFHEGAAEVWAARLPVHLDRRLAEAVAAAR